MVSGFILAFSLVALIRFGILYCRGIMLRTAELPVSEEVRAAAHLSGEEITGRDFAALAGVLSLTPGGSGGLRSVGRAGNGDLRAVRRSADRWAVADVLRGAGGPLKRV
jgi:hypothetical protein